jgi:hypothetical protein
MRRPSDPPRWAAALLVRFLQMKDRETIAGDLLEEYQDAIQAGTRRFAADCRYVRQTLSIVSVKGNRIVAIGSSSPPPDGALLVDGTGRYLLPGLTDSHVHLTTDMPWAPARADFGDAPLYLAHGVTTVVNLRGTPTQLDWKRRIEAGEMLGPTIYTSGDFVNEPRVMTSDEVRREVAAQARDGYDLIKFHEVWTPRTGFATRRGLPRESYVRMFEAARKEGLPVVGHAPLNLGLDGLFASSGGAVAPVGELVRLYFRPPLRVLLANIAAAAILLFVVAGWAIAALLRRWRGTKLTSKTLTRVRTFTAFVLVTYLATFVVASLAGIGGQFFDSTGWRFGFVALSCGLVFVSLLTVLASVRVWRDRTVPISSRLPVMLAALASLVVAYTVSVYSIPSMWKINTLNSRARSPARSIATAFNCSLEPTRWAFRWLSPAARSSVNSTCFIRAD